MLPIILFTPTTSKEMDSSYNIIIKKIGTVCRTSQKKLEWYSLNRL